MKYRPSIVIFAGDGARPSGALFRAQLDLRADLVSCVDLGGAEEDDTTRHMMMTALGLFTADRLDSLVRDGLLDNIEVRDIPVLVVVHHSDSKLLRKAALH